MNSMTWPTKKECDSLNHIIFNNPEEPFASARFVKKQEINDFVGRKAELDQFKHILNNILQEQGSKAVRLEGAAGVGKSTLFNYLKQSIEKERATPQGYSTYISNENDILSVYFDIPGKIERFGDLWVDIMGGLRSNFEKELGIDISLPEYVALNLISLFLKQDFSNVSKIFQKYAPFTPQFRISDLRSILDFVEDYPDLIDDLKYYYRTNYRKLLPHMSAKIRSNVFKISRNDSRFIVELLEVLNVKNYEYLEKINDGTHFRNTREYLAYLNELLKIYTCCVKKQPILLIGIDEFAKKYSNAEKGYYISLSQIFIELRNNLINTLFVFISTAEDWAQYDKEISMKSDLLGQVSDFMTKMLLTALPEKDVIQVFRNRMNNFWKIYGAERSSLAQFYPFSDAFFEYVFRSCRRDLRRTIILLSNLWGTFKSRRRIPKMETYFEAMHVIANALKRDISARNFESYDWRIIEKEFNNPTRFSTNSQRSSAIESGLEKAWNILRNSNQYDISRVENNPTFTIKGHRRRPDVLVYFREQLGTEFRRVVEFQVKAYSEKSTVDWKHIETSLELLKAGITDYIFIINTGKGLDHKAEMKVRELESDFPNNICYPVLNQMQLQVLYYLSLFEEISGETLKNNPETVENMKFCIQTILGQPLQEFTSKLFNLKINKEVNAQMVEEIEQIAIDKQSEQFTQHQVEDYIPLKPSSAIVTEISVHKKENLRLQDENFPEIISTENPDNSSSSWIDEYPKLKPFRYELCELCHYMKSRESGKYKHKFTKSTVIKNRIMTNALLSKTNFNKLIDALFEEHYIEKEKSSFKWTDSGFRLYLYAKENNFKIE